MGPGSHGVLQHRPRLRGASLRDAQQGPPRLRIPSRRRRTAEVVVRRPVLTTQPAEVGELIVGDIAGGEVPGAKSLLGLYGSLL